jgi:hypothetical protein
MLFNSNKWIGGIWRIRRILISRCNLKNQLCNANCLDETTIHVDTILNLSLYYLVNDLIHLPNLINNPAHVEASREEFSLWSMQLASRACVQEVDYLKLVFIEDYSFKIMTARKLRSVTKATKIGFFQPSFTCYSVCTFSFLFDDVFNYHK